MEERQAESVEKIWDNGSEETEEIFEQLGQVKKRSDEVTKDEVVE